MRSSRSLGAVCAKLTVPANWAAPTATRATKPKLRVMAASIAGCLLVNRALRPTISRSLPGPTFLDVAKSCGNPNFLPAPESPHTRIQVRRFQARIDRSIGLVHDSVGWTAGVGDQPRRRYRGPTRVPIPGIAVGSIGHAQHRLDRPPLRGVLRRAIDLGGRVEGQHTPHQHSPLLATMDQ